MLIVKPTGKIVQQLRLSATPDIGTQIRNKLVLLVISQQKRKKKNKSHRIMSSLTTLCTEPKNQKSPRENIEKPHKRQNVL